MLPTVLGCKIIVQDERYVLSYLYSSNLKCGIQQQLLHFIYTYTLYMYLQHSLFFLIFLSPMTLIFISKRYIHIFNQASTTRSPDALKFGVSVSEKLNKTKQKGTKGSEIYNRYILNSYTYQCIALYNT